jgi:hypothetical protein
MRRTWRQRLRALFATPSILLCLCAAAPVAQADYRVATFEADITIPIGHACMGGGIADAKEIADPLFAKGFVLIGAPEPVVVVALDWCQCNNDSYDRWRDALAEAAGTTRRRVLLATVHQHDAPICDLRAQALLDAHGMHRSVCDPEFHEQTVQKVAAALRRSLGSTRRVTHVGVGQAVVKELASNRRVVGAGGTVRWDRSSSSRDYDDAPEGETDPYVKTISLWDGERPVLAWSCYAVHPMSHYGRGAVSADFVGLARARRQAEDPSVLQIYFTGCAGDTTAGKYNNGEPAERAALAEKLYRAMAEAWKATRRSPLEGISLRSAALRLPPREGGDFDAAAMRRILADERESRWRRNCAALGLSWRERVAAGRPIDVPCLDLGTGVAQFMVLPAEAFVGYQRLAQSLRPDSFVMVAGFGDGAPGYIPTDACFAEGYADSYCWVAPDVEQRITRAMADALGPQRPDGALRETTLEVVRRELSPDFCWFHPRAAAIPGAGRDGMPAVVLTLQKHLKVSDYYSGLYVMRTDDLGASWTGPAEVPELGWKAGDEGTTRAVCDVTPSWHGPSGRLLAIGVQVDYDKSGAQRDDHPSPTAYAVYDPAKRNWSGWQTLQMPEEKKFRIARNGCGQWVVEADGTVLLPIYFAPAAGQPYAVTVVRCRFDGSRLTYVEHGDELKLVPNVSRGLVEPSLVRFGGRYLLTIRNDEKGYVTRGDDGLRYRDGLKPWTFDDGADFGSYNTQQHWLAGGDELFLAYTRRGAANDHIMRHRAPLFLARVHPQHLTVVRSSERILIPERGAALGNFGAAAVTREESWVTDAEFITGTRRDPRGADGSVFLARVRWQPDGAPQSKTHSP